MSPKYYIQVGITSMRTPDDEILVDVPLYIRVGEIQPNGLAKVEETILRTITDIVCKHNEQLVEKIQKNKEIKNEQNKISG